MPFWNFFAFNADSVAQAILRPVQQAIRNQDLPLWQRLFDQLSRTHPAPRVLYGRYSPNVSTLLGFVPGDAELSPDSLPQETDFTLRRILQTFIEHVADHRLQSSMTKPRHWVCNEIYWPGILKSKDELAEIEAFKKDIIERRQKIEDPFWCLESNSAVDSNYVNADVVKKMAEMESSFGLFRGLVKREDLDAELKVIAEDLARAGLLIELTAREGLALLFREDGT